jgi:hypothetical protein
VQQVRDRCAHARLLVALLDLMSMPAPCSALVKAFFRGIGDDLGGVGEEGGLWFRRRLQPRDGTVPAPTS